MQKLFLYTPSKNTEVTEMQKYARKQKKKQRKFFLKNPGVRSKHFHSRA